MTLVSDFVGWLAYDATAAHRRLSQGAQEGRQRPRPLPSGAAGMEPKRVAPLPARREPRILQARRVIGTPVLDASGAKAGRIADLSIDKRTGQVVYALIGVEGGLGFLKRIVPVPWALLRYDAAKGGYAAPADREDLARGPALTPEELQSLGAGDDAWRERLAIYYSPYLTLPFI